MAYEECTVVGRNAVMEAYRSGKTIDKLFILDGCQDGPIKSILREARKRDTLIKFVSKEKLDSLSFHEKHQGVVAIAAAYEYATVEDLFKKAEEKGEAPFFILCDEIEDPHNLGAILRTADASGVDGIIIRKDRSVGLTSTVAKLSTGAIEHVPVACVANLTVAINQLKEAGLWIAGTDASEAQDYRTLDASLPLGLVIGSEGKGMSRLVREACDFKVYLPMRGHVTSLNASVAAALLMYEIYNKRNPIK